MYYYMTDYQEKYVKYKTKYIDLRDQLMVGGSGIKCEINDDDTVLFGHGGSTAIIVITKGHRVYKIFTTYYYSTPKDKINSVLKDLNRNVDNEMNIYKEITKHIMDTGISDHYVRYIGQSECKNAKNIFKKCPDTYVEFLKIKTDYISNLCLSKLRQYPAKQLIDEYRTVEIEYCNYDCDDFIKDISQTTIFEMEQYLNIFFFQIIYTIMSTQKVYPNFVHRDLFIRNILGNKENDNGNYYTYIYGDKQYSVPQKIFFPKINDFGMTNLDDTYHDNDLFSSKIKDIYNILYDVYNGGNLGSKSLVVLCENDERKQTFLKKYFSNYFNVNIIDEFIYNSKSNMDWDWDNILDDEFFKKIEMKSPDDILNIYFYDIFGKSNEEIKEFKSK